MTVYTVSNSSSRRFSAPFWPLWESHTYILYLHKCRQNINKQTKIQKDIRHIALKINIY